MPKLKPISIEQTKLVLVEGADAHRFCIWACAAIRPDQIQVLDSGGITEMRLNLGNLRNVEGYDSVTSIVVARDAETDASAAFQSVCDGLAAAGLPLPSAPFVLSDSLPRIAVMLFPGVKETPEGVSCYSGTLEDLCLSMVVGARELQCVDRFQECLGELGVSARRPHKFRLHAYLTSRDEFVGLKIGEAAKAKAWDWDHEAFRPFRRIIEQM